MRKFIFFLIAAMSSWLILYAVPSGADDAKRTLHGTVTYHERIALQANAYAIVEARSKDGKVDAEQAVRVRIGALPASFEGELPCTDCPAIRYHLDLFPDRLYFLRTKYEGTQRQLDTVGTWMGNPSGSLLTLQSERRSGLTFEIMDTATLLWPPRRMASSAYWPRTSYVLKRTSSFQPVEPRATLTGIYRHVAGSGVLEICAGLSQSRLPVAQEGANAALEAAYVHLVPAARGDVLAQFEGRIAMQPKPEGEGLQPTLIVERVIELKPGETCKTHLTAIQLEDTPWTLTHLGDGAVPSGYDRTQPYFNLSTMDLRVTGNAGCAQMTGRYSLDGSKLEFGKIATTMNAYCRGGMDIQRAFLEALERVKTWRLDGRHLELLDVDGKPVARFQAQN